MFPEADAIQYDSEDLRAAREFASGTSTFPPKFEYSIRIKPGKEGLSLNVSLSHLYPVEKKAQLYISSNSLTRQSQVSINANLSEHLGTLCEGELEVGCAISWLQEHADEYIPKKSAEAKEKVEEWFMARFWIYAHHIFSKTKRKDMKKYADELEIVGFVLPGKPGIICVEGLNGNVLDWWHIVRSWCWQRISCVHEETEMFHDADSASKFFRFQGFRELSPIDIKAKTAKTFDMGAFQAYLEENDSGYIFKHLFDL